MQLLLAEIHVDDRWIHCYAISLTFSLFIATIISLFFSNKIKKKNYVKTGLAKTRPARPLTTAMIHRPHWGPHTGVWHSGPQKHGEWCEMWSTFSEVLHENGANCHFWSPHTWPLTTINSIARGMQCVLTLLWGVNTVGEEHPQRWHMLNAWKDVLLGKNSGLRLALFSYHPGKKVWIVF